MKFSKLLFALSLMALMAGMAQAQSLNYYCRATVATSSEDASVSVVATKKFVLSELQLNYKVSFSEKKLWNVKAGGIKSQSLAGTLLESGFDLDVLLSGKQDGEKFLNANVALHPSGRGSSDVVRSENSVKTLVQEAGVFSSSGFVKLPAQDAGATTVSFILNCSNSLKLVDAI
ncbi:MAG TPA: hypothetical protein VNJ01_03355 [Bacteriovoracaceae bacterium]|nr:hypothetical protein [Bacteriovoracaceae bacterium]